MTVLAPRNFGWWTPAGWGGIKLGQAAGATSSANFVVNASGALVGSGTYSFSAPVTKATGASAWVGKTIGQTENVTLPSGDTIVITFTNEHHVTEYDGTATTDELAKLFQAEIATAAWANPDLRANVTRKIILRDGSYFNQFPTNSYDHRIPNDGWPGAVTITNVGSSYSASPVDGWVGYPLVAITGVGTGAVANFRVVSGTVRQVFVTEPGTGYAPGDTVSAPTLPVGSGFVGTVVDMAARLTIESETPDLVGTDEFGNHTWGGSAKHGGLGLTGRDYNHPITFQYIYWYYNGALTGRLAFLGHRNAGGDYGFMAYRNHFENGPAVLVNGRNYALLNRGGIVRENYIKNCQRGLTNAGTAVSFNKLTTIQSNIIRNCSDGMTLNCQNYLIEDNFIFDNTNKPGDHPDGIQHTGVIGLVAGGSGYTPGTWLNVPMVGAGAVAVLARVTVAGNGTVNASGGCVLTGWTTAPEGVVLTIDPSETRLGAGINFSYTTPVSIENFGIWRRNIIVRGSLPAGGEDSQGIFLSDTRPPAFIGGLLSENNIIFNTIAFQHLLTRFKNSTIRRSTILGQLNSNSNVSVNPSSTVQLDIPSGPVNNNATNVVDAVVSNNINNFSDKTTCVEIGIANPTPVATSMAAYTLAFPNIQHGSTPGYNTRAAVIAAATPAIRSVATGGMKRPNGTFIGALLPDGSWNDGRVYDAVAPTSYAVSVIEDDIMVGAPCTITAQLNSPAAADTTITGTRSGTATGANVTIVVLAGQSSGSGTFTATGAGTATLAWSDDKGLADAANLVLTATVASDPPTAFTQAVDNPLRSVGAPFVFTYTLNRVAISPVTITPTFPMAGVATPPTLVIGAGESQGQISFRASVVAQGNATADDDGGLTNPSPVMITSVISHVVRGQYLAMFRR